MRRFTKILLFLLLLSPASLAAGGKKMPSAQNVCDQFERESHIRLGRVALTFVKPIIRLALDEDDEARTIIRSIKRVDIATYRVIELPETVGTAVLRRIETRMTDSGWNRIVRSREEDDNLWVFARHRDNGGISGIFVVELDNHELNFIGVAGRLDEILANAIAEEPGEFSSLFSS